MRIEINKTLKEKGLDQVTKQHLNDQKQELLSNIETLQNSLEIANKELNERKLASRHAKKVEQEIWKKRGKLEKSIRMQIEQDIFPKYNVHISSYHGGKMEGPSTRQLMHNGKDIFAEISEHIKQSLGSEQNRDKTNLATDREIDDICTTTGSIFLLMDSVFSHIYSIHGRSTETEVKVLTKRLTLLARIWTKAGLRYTPKFHTLMNHVCNQITNIAGYSLMGEDRIERAHQSRARIASLLMRLRDKSKLMNLQAKLQNVACLGDIQKIQSDVQMNSKRTLKRKTSLKVERDEVKREKRNDKRDLEISARSTDTDTSIITSARDRIKENIKNSNDN